MSVDQISTVLALLAFLALMIGVGVDVALLGGQHDRLRPYVELMAPIAFAIAVVSVLGSLYYSGIQHFRPCRLCWWQRIAMYPLVPVLAVGLLRRDRAVSYYALPLALMGLAYSGYHTWLRWFPGDSSSCDLDAPCSAIWVDTFGFVSIPFMALCGFVAITALLSASILLGRPETDDLYDGSLHITEQGQHQ